MTDSPNVFRPRRIRIAQDGWGGYTGDFGQVAFKDGVSVDLVPWLEQQRLGGLIMIESAEEDEVGTQVSPSAELLRNRDRPFDESVLAAVEAIVTTPAGEVRVAGSLHTREELEAIADRKGLAGLRDVAKAWGVKGRGIAELIRDILEAQSKASPPAAPAAPEVTGEAPPAPEAPEAPEEAPEAVHDPA